MESNVQQVPSSGGRLIAPEWSQILPQASVSASMTQAQASMAFTGHVQPPPQTPPVLPLQIYLFLCH